MGLQPPALLRKSVAETLAYFDNFSYPLTLRELWFWQAGTWFPQSSISGVLPPKSRYFYRRGRNYLAGQRNERLMFSRRKLEFITPVILSIGYLPFIKAVFITGALAMSNSPPDDDIDILVITRRQTLWLARFIVTIYLKLKNLRRHPYLPEHSSVRVSDKICDNLWLDEDHLFQSNQSLYTAHELLQAKCIFDRGGVYNSFISGNAWVKEYLPIAYRETIKNLNNFKINKLNKNWKFKIENLILWVINLIMFLVQYLYMCPRLTSEKVGLGYAYFHPRSG